MRPRAGQGEVRPSKVGGWVGDMRADKAVAVWEDARPRKVRAEGQT